MRMNSPALIIQTNPSARGFNITHKKWGSHTILRIDIYLDRVTKSWSLSMGHYLTVRLVRQTPRRAIQSAIQFRFSQADDDTGSASAALRSTAGWPEAMAGGRRRQLGACVSTAKGRAVAFSPCCLWIGLRYVWHAEIAVRTLMGTAESNSCLRYCAFWFCDSKSLQRNLVYATPSFKY